MTEEHPFSKEEKEIMDLLVAAHNKYCTLKSEHPSETEDWCRAFHLLQDVLIVRTAIRKYPYFRKKN